jgi:hypothetical protein
MRFEHAQNGFEHGRPVPSVAPAVYDEPPTPPQERGEVARGILALVMRGRTARAQLLRLAVLNSIVGGPGTPLEIARRLGLTKRRVLQEFSAVRNFIKGPR